MHTFSAGTVGPEVRRLASLAWPVVLSQLGMVTLGVADVVMLGRLGQEAIGAVGIGNTWSFGVLVLGMGTAMGIDPLVAQAYGRGKPTQAGAALVRGSAVLTLLALPMIALHLLAAPLLTLLQQPPHLVPIAAAYCRVVALSIPAFLGFALFRQFLQGSGTMRPALYVLIAGNLLNLLINDALIFGRYGLPALGVTGAAWATVAARWLMFAMLIAIGWRHLKAAWPRDLSGLLTLPALGAVAWMAIPTGFQVSLEVWAFSATSLLAGWLGDVPIAAHTVALSITSVLFMVPMGLGAAAATRIGNLVGAQRPWLNAAAAALLSTVGVMLIWAILLLLLPRHLVGLYTTDPPVVALALLIFPIAAAFQLFDGVQAVTFGLLRGLGDTRWPALAPVFGHWMCGLPMGAWLALGTPLGLPGLWIGLSLGLAVVAALLLLRLGWHRRQVLRLAAP